MPDLKFVIFVLSLGLLTMAKPAVVPQLLIDAAPSVVSYQGSSQAHTRFVIAPMGRSLGYVEPTNVNRTFHNNNQHNSESGGYEVLNISPVYVHQ